MELIAILLGELLFAPILAALVVVIELGGLVVGLLLRLVLGLKRAPTPAAHAGPVRPRWLRPVLLLLAALLGLSTLFLLVLELFFFSGTLRWALDRVHAKTGITVEFAAAEGSLFGGSTVLSGVRIRRASGDRPRYDLTIDRLDLDLQVTSLLGSTVVFEHLLVTDVRGTITWPDAEDRPDPPAKKPFRIEKLEITDLQLALDDQAKTKKSYEIAVDQWASQPFRSNWVPFDVLFRSNAAGKLAGSDFEIRSDAIDGGRHTVWRADNLPMWYLASKVGGPFAKLRIGTADVYVDDRWSRDRTAEIDSRWRITFKAIEAKNPLLRKAVEKLGTKTLEFRLVLDGNGLSTSSTDTEAKGFWGEVGKALFMQLLGR